MQVALNHGFIFFRHHQNVDALVGKKDNGGNFLKGVRHLSRKCL